VTYCYKCPNCETRFEHGAHGLDMECWVCQEDSFIRDYKSERVGANLRHLRISSAPGYSDDLILPTAKDYESPTDPDGSKGIKQWREEHIPAPGNKNPKWPTVPAGSRDTFTFSGGK
jgi:hypothetical protein